MEFKLEQVSTADIKKAPYQRPLSVKRVEQIVENFKPEIANIVKVSFRDGVYWVFDGQHTMQALKEMNGGEDCQVLCQVYRGLTEEDEALLFAEQNGISRQVSKASKLRAKYMGKDPEVMHMCAVVESLGLEADMTGGIKNKKPNIIIANARLYKLYQENSEEDFKKVLMLCRDSWPENPDAFCREMLSAVHLFNKVYKGDYSFKRAIKQFGTKTPAEIIRDSKLAANMSRNWSCAYQMTNIYNKGTRGKNRLNTMLTYVFK